MAMGDALAVVLLDRKQFKECDFRRNHPGGSLGERLKVNVSEVMITGEDIPLVKKDTSLRQAVSILNAKNLGAVLIVDAEQRVAGIITDGDIRRMVAKEVNLDTQFAVDHMTPGPKTISKELLAADALSIMQEHEITILPITDAKGHLAGVLHLHDLLGKGEFRFMV
jgi:arabinose-5-phosphate isomerase